MSGNLSLMIFFFSVFGLVYSQGSPNVCRSYYGYFTDKDKNPECFHDPDVDASFEERAQNHGLLAERHYIRTEDSWILTTFRLKNSNGTYGKGVVFLQHGLGTDSMSFTGNGNKSMAYFLTEQGYDVWLGNFRGTEFTSHQYLQRNDKQYWDFSHHEHGLYDLPANFKYISAKTKSKIHYIGHSMGTTAIAIYFTTKPEEAMKLVKHTITLCGTTLMRNTKGLLSFNFINNVLKLLKLIPKPNLYVLLLDDSLERKLAIQTCFASWQNLKLCLALNEYVAGSGGYPMSPEKFALAIRSFRNMGVKSMLHYAQIVQSREFRMFDYGPMENLMRYNSTIPPNYDLTKLPSNMTWIYGAHDQLATKQDTLLVFEQYRKPNWEVYEIPYNHINYFHDYKYVDKIFFPVLLKIINKFI